MTVRVRFAPSPTGFLHVGGARTALYNWLWARHNNGTFILRIEDTDAERSTEESTQQILDSLEWLGMKWDEGPFYQSKRGDVYEEHLRRLVESGHAYRCFCTPERIDGLRQQAMAEKRNFTYDRACLKLSEEEVEQRLADGVPFTWRFRVPEGETNVPETLLSGTADCRFVNEDLGDFNLTRAGTEGNWGKPLYNFCCAIDDADMQITHVIRGSDHLTNTARQMMVLEALGYPVPTYTHLPLIMKANKKMSKRDEDADPRFPVSVSARRDLGYLHEATMNFIALAGWSFDDKAEIFSAEDLIEKFSLDGLSKSNANFDEDKYLYMNGYWLRNLPPAEIVERAKPFLERAGLSAPERGEEWLATIIGLAIERVRLLSEFPEALDFFFRAPETFEEKGVKKAFGKEGTELNLRAAAKAIEALDDFSHDGLEAALRALAEEIGIGFGKIAQPIRLATTGRMASPGLFDVLVNLGKSECVARINRAAELIEKGTVPTA
ncbi:glutamate--tRNA ligase [bacterium]|nr:glutamate--tRNA ligase [bacterium]